jgi:hypothetical protein
VLRGTKLALTLVMLDRSLGGIRCFTVRRIAHHGGYLPSKMAGTIRYTTENLGRTLVRVDFDSGQSVMVLSGDVTLDVHSEHGARQDA